MTDTDTHISGTAGTYIPGVCNIGPAEIRRRRNTGLAGGAIAAVTLAGLLATRAPAPLRALVAVPAAGAATGLLQARMHFCSGFGLNGIFNMAEVGSTDSVDDAAYRRADRQKAITILVGSVGIGAGVGALALLLP